MTTDDRPESPDVTIASDLLVENWRGELDAVEIYKLLARYERSEERSQILLEMVKDEERHAEVMARRLEEIGVPLPEYRVSVRIRVLGFLARVFGTGAVLPIVSSIEAEDVTAYLKPEQDPAVQDMAGDERRHYRALGSLSGRPEAANIARHERWHPWRASPIFQ